VRVKSISPTIVVFGLLGPLVALGSASDDYQLIDDRIVVLGHELTTAEELPDLSCEECGSAHNVSLIWSPDDRRALVVSDVQLANFDAWIFDRRDDAPPSRIAAQRAGRHLTKAAWHGNHKVELTFAGMGYAATILVDVSQPTDARELDNCLLFDAGRDVYVRYTWDANSKAREIEVGTVFAGSRSVERFPIALDNEYHSDSMGMIKTVEIHGDELTVTYDTDARGIVRDVFRPRVLAGGE